MRFKYVCWEADKLNFGLLNKNGNTFLRYIYLTNLFLGKTEMPINKKIQRTNALWI